MSCYGCFNGCTQIISDQCVRYTGPDIPDLGIEGGIPLSELEEKITDFLLTVLDGSGILPTIDPNDLCILLRTYLPISGDITLNDVVSAIFQAVCDLQSQIDTIDTTLTTLNANYTIGCLTGVTASSGTHAILQAVITKLCALSLSVTALQTAISQYVKISDLNNLIQDYLDSITANGMYTKMVPYTAVEYYGPLAGYPTATDGFDVNGVGYGAWIHVYLCTGYNGLTPDKRGRVPVGCNNMGCGPYVTPETDPANPLNPNYDLMDVAGINYTILSKDQLPPHNHPANSSVVDPGHRHLIFGDEYIGDYAGYTRYTEIIGPHLTSPTHEKNDAANYYTKNEVGINTKASQTTGITVSTVTLNTGLGDLHDNRPPVLACYYIMYVP